MASSRNSPSLYVRFADPTTGAPRLWNQRTQPVETEERTEYLLSRWAEQRGRAEESRQNVEVNDEDSDDWENYDDDDIDEEVTTRSNCEDLPPDFHTLFPESSDQQGDEEIQRKQMVADTGDIDIERHAPENDEESRKSTNKTWTTKVSRLNRVIKSTNYECYFLDIPDQFRFGEILARNRRIDVCYIRNC